MLAGACLIVTATFAISATLAEVCSLLSAILVSTAAPLNSAKAHYNDYTSVLRRFTSLRHYMISFNFKRYRIFLTSKLVKRTKSRRTCFCV